MVTCIMHNIVDGLHFVCCVCFVSDRMHGPKLFAHDRKWSKCGLHTLSKIKNILICIGRGWRLIAQSILDLSHSHTIYFKCNRHFHSVCWFRFDFISLNMYFIVIILVHFKLLFLQIGKMLQNVSCVRFDFNQENYFCCCCGNEIRFMFLLLSIFEVKKSCSVWAIVCCVCDQLIFLFFFYFDLMVFCVLQIRWELVYELWYILVFYILDLFLLFAFTCMEKLNEQLN